MNVGDIVYITQDAIEFVKDGNRVSALYMNASEVNRPARIVYLDNKMAHIMFEDRPDEYTIVNVRWLNQWNEFANIEQVEDFLADDRVCGDRGPRMGAEGVMICKRPLNHEGKHKPAPDDGWGDQSW